MLKTNSKKALENIRSYIVDNFTPDNYDLEPSNDFATVAKVIYNCFIEEKSGINDWGRASESVIFDDWTQGLPSILNLTTLPMLDHDDYYNHCTALDDLGVILEETEAEQARFTETDAEKLLTSLIFREIKKAVKDV